MTNSKNLNQDKKKKTFTFDSRIDYALILPVFMLLVIGFYALYVAITHDFQAEATRLLTTQASWIVIGIFAAIIVMHLNSKILWNLTPAIYVIGLLLMVLPIFFYSEATYLSTGAKNWVAIGGTNLFQPSEFMKIAYILFLAHLTVTFNEKLKTPSVKQDFRLILRLILATVPVALFSLVQHDFGTFLVFVVIFIGVVLVSGVSWKIIIPALAVLGGLIATVVLMVNNPTGQTILTHVGFGQYQVNRFVAWLHPFEYAQGISLQQAQSLTAIGTGGLTGKGINVADLQIPVRESDMIFTIIAENFGFIGAAFTILLYFFLIFRMIRVTMKSNNNFYIFISTGIIMMLLFHVFENIGAAIGVVPLTGVPLPFISQGGSALMSDLIAVGLVLAMQYNQLPDFEILRTKNRSNLTKRRAKLVKNK